MIYVSWGLREALGCKRVTERPTRRAKLGE
jgi:hypothetical protein